MAHNNNEKTANAHVSEYFDGLLDLIENGRASAVASPHDNDPAPEAMNKAEQEQYLAELDEYYTQQKRLGHLKELPDYEIARQSLKHFHLAVDNSPFIAAINNITSHGSKPVMVFNDDGLLYRDPETKEVVVAGCSTCLADAAVLAVKLASQRGTFGRKKTELLITGDKDFTILCIEACKQAGLKPVLPKGSEHFMDEYKKAKARIDAGEVVLPLTVSEQRKKQEAGAGGMSL